MSDEERRFLTREELAALAEKGQSADDTQAEADRLVAGDGEGDVSEDLDGAKEIAESHAEHRLLEGLARSGALGPGGEEVTEDEIAAAMPPREDEETRPVVLSQQPEIVNPEAPARIVVEPAPVDEDRMAMLKEVVQADKKDREQLGGCRALLRHLVATQDVRTRWPCPVCDRKSTDQPPADVKYRTTEGRSYYDQCWFCARMAPLIEEAKALLGE